MNTTPSNLESQTFHALRFPMIVMIVFIHAYGTDLPAGMWGYGGYHVLRTLMSHVIPSAAVPVFFVMSGYYFFRHTHFNSTSYADKLMKRARTLLVPYLLWNVIGLVYTISVRWLGARYGGALANGHSWNGIGDFMAERGYLDVFWSCYKQYAVSDWLGTVHSPSFFSPILFPLWYVRDLMVMCVLSPLFYTCIRKSGRAFLAVLLLSYLSGIAFYVPGLSSTALLFFGLGAYLAIHQGNALEAFRRVRIPAYILYLFLLVPAIRMDGTADLTGQFVRNICVLTGVAVFVNLAADILEHTHLRPHPSLGQSAFFIYAIHMTGLLQLTSLAMNRLLPASHAALAALNYLLTPLLCVAIGYTIYRLLKRYLPQPTGWLTGNR